MLNLGNFKNCSRPGKKASKSRYRDASRRLRNTALNHPAIEISVSSYTESQAYHQFHQHFTSTLFANILAPKNFKPKTQPCNFWRQNIGKKLALKMLMKLTQDLRH